MDSDRVVVGETSVEADSATGVGKFAVMAGLAINLAGVVSPVKTQGIQPGELNATERFVQVWGDCVDE